MTNLTANWRTSIFGSVTLLAAFLSQFPELLDSILDPVAAKKIASVCAVITGFITFVNTKDKQVSGNGTINAPLKIPANDGTDYSRTIHP